ncbi:deoxyribonuclease IV [Nocardioides gansuensis]|uniref:deoxyribonuclease IV n=1 Tax=Nocardioides gansuensis TaxID=2138300 RepID=UPI001FEC9F3A|nr:deoxyribonuclease IV [Nocardioides gansuensis]
MIPAPSSIAERNPIGTHVIVGKGLVAGALANADEVGCETIQVFTGNPRGWAHSAGKPADDRAFRAECERRGMRTFIHSPYLVNLGSPTALTYERSVGIVAHNLRRAAQIGAEGVVVHTGSYVSVGDSEARYAAALRQVREGLLPILDAIADEAAPWLLLEPTAGQGRSLCAGVDDLEPYLEALDFHPKAGICLDTCHAFAAGVPLDEPGGATAAVDRIVEIGGPGRLRLVHANDSMDVRGAHLDRHQQIGRGHIGEDPFRELFAHPELAGVPFILETPGSRDADSTDFPTLRRLRDEAAAGLDSARPSDSARPADAARPADSARRAGTSA